MGGYRDLKVWRESMQLAKKIYTLTSRFPAEEKYGLVSQMRRAVVSIPSNIAEGHGRGSSNEMARFCSIAKGSLYELQTQVLLSEQLGFLESTEAQNALSTAEELAKMLAGLIRSTQA